MTRGRPDRELTGCAEPCHEPARRPPPTRHPPHARLDPSLHGPRRGSAARIVQRAALFLGVATTATALVGASPIVAHWPGMSLVTLRGHLYEDMVGPRRNGLRAPSTVGNAVTCGKQCAA